MDEDFLPAVFPFLLEVDASLRLIRTGPLMARVCPRARVGDVLTECFEVRTGTGPIVSFPALREAVNRAVVVRFMADASHDLRGEWMVSSDGERLVFLGWPSIIDGDDLAGWGLSLNDLPAHNPLGDMLMLLTTSRNTLADTRELTARLRARTSALEEANRRLDHQASHDTLTSLPNRRLLRDRLDQVIRQASRNGHQLAVLFVDLDHFKPINDTFGHAFGDVLLQQVAQRIGSELRASDSVGREGGDEFVVVLGAGEPADIVDDSALVARKLLAALSRYFEVDGRSVRIGASIGIAVFPLDGVQAGELIQRADVAMYAAKRSERGGYRFCTPEIHASVLKRYALEEALREAVERDEFELFFQPVIDLASGRPIGAEALLRWRHPDRGLLLPGEFIAVAEDTGLIEPIGEWVLRESCRLAALWPGREGETFRVSVNVSARQLVGQRFDRAVAAALEASGLAPDRLMLELTETAVMGDPEAARRTLCQLSAQGIGLALDDFGTGYGNLRTLASLPFDVLKVDRDFMADFDTPSSGRIMMLTIFDMARHMNMTVVAEGVESLQQHQFLRQTNCRFAQGYWYSRPVPAGELSALLALGRSLISGPG